VTVGLGGVAEVSSFVLSNNDSYDDFLFSYELDDSVGIQTLVWRISI
jgi:hypothetical protein